MMSAGRLVAHVTTVHRRADIRIFHKECISLARAGYEVVQVIGDGGGDAVVDGVRIVDVGAPPAGRLARMRNQPKRVGEVLRRLRPALLHFHDPELLPLGSAFARGGMPAIYDAHEDVPRQVLTKGWIAAPLRPAVAWAFERYENMLARRLTAVVAATPHIARRFATVAPRTVVVANYPFPDELAPAPNAAPRERAVCYAGGIMRTRGAFEMVRALALLPDVTLHLAGTFEDAGLEAELRGEPGWRRVQWHGYLDRAALRALFARCGAGLLTLLPMPSYLDSLPIKMFEYMSAELPVIASDFPLWRGIVNGHGCGRCVNPASPAEIASAIDATLSDPVAARRMGSAGRAAVLEHYGWASQEANLLALYRDLLR